VVRGCTPAVDPSMAGHAATAFAEPGSADRASPDRPTRSGRLAWRPLERRDRTLLSPEAAIAPAQAIFGRPHLGSRPRV